MSDEGGQDSAQPSLRVRQQTAKARATKERRVAEATQKILKKKRGGWRPNSGRRPNYLKRSKLAPIEAHMILAHVDVVRIWLDLINSKDAELKFRVMQYLTDRQLGKPKEFGEFRSEYSGTQAFTIQFVDGAGLRTSEHAELVPTVDSKSTQTEVLPPATGMDPTPLPQGDCTVHGRYPLPRHDAQHICPACQKEAAWAERKLLSLMPGGWA